LTVNIIITFYPTNRFKTDEMEHDKGVHTHAAWDLIRAQSQPQEHLKEGGKMVDFAGGHFLCHGRWQMIPSIVL